MADPFAPQEFSRNLIDDLLEQADRDLELERKRQESIITSEEPEAVLSGLSKVEKQIENEPEEVQRSVLDKAYSPGYFDRGVRGGNINRPMQEYSPVKNQQEKKQPFSETLYESLASGSARLGHGLATAPGFIYSLASLPQKGLAKIPGLEFMDDGTREMEEYLINNPVATYYKEQADHYREENTRYDQGITDYIKEGNIVDALGLTVSSIVESIPVTASIMAGGYYGLAPKVMVPIVTAVTGGSKNATLLEEMPEMADDTRILNALVDGLSEGVFEQMGSAGIGRTLKKVRSDLARTLGRKEGDKVLKETIKKTFQDKSSRYIVPKAMNQEGWEEFATTVMQNLNAQLTGEDPDRELFEGAVDSYIVGAGSGGALSAPTAIQVRGQRKQLEAQQQEAEEIQSRVNNIETDQDVRRLASELNIKDQQKEGTDFVGKLINKAESESGVTIEREFLDRTMADEIQDEELSDEQVKEILTDHGISEDANPEDLMVVGRTSDGVIRISTAGTADRMADEFVAVNEEMSEVFYNAEVENRGEEFTNEIKEERKNFYEATGETDKGESDQEWFSSTAVRFAVQGKVHQSIGARLRDVFDRFVAQAKLILRDSFRLRKAIREGKVSESLIQKLEQATDFKTVGKKVKQAKKVQQVAKIEGRKATPDGGVTYRISEVGKVDPVGVFVIGADMVARDLDGKLNPFGLRYTENFQGFQLSKAGATKLVKNGKEGFNTVAVIAYDDIKGSQVANPSFQNRVKEKLIKVIGKRRLNKLLKENNNNVQVISGIVNKEIQEANKNKAKKDKKEKINLTEIAKDNAEPDSPQLRRKIIYVGTLKEIRTGKDRFEKHDVYPAEQIFDTLVELKEPIPIDDLIADLPDTDMRKKNWGMLVTQTNFMMTADESNVSKQLMEMAEIGQDVFTGTPNPDYQFFSRETETITPEEAVDRSEGERQFKARQFVSQVDEELGLGTATRSSVGFTEEYGDESSLVSRFFGKQDPELLEYRGALIGLMFNQIDVTTFIGDPDGKDSLLKITIPKTDLKTLKGALTKLGVQNKTIRSRGNKQDILLWNFGDIDVNFIHAIAEKYNYENYSEENGQFRFITDESSREKARERFIEIVQNYQSKTNKSLPKAFNKFLPDFYSRKADRNKLQKQLKAKPKPSYRITESSYKLDSLDSFELFETAKKIFGTTENSKEAGYILPDGTMLDFSGKSEGGTPGVRAFDHRQINEVGYELPKNIVKKLQENNVDGIGMEEFIYHGAIRWMPEAGSFNLMNKPDPQQLSIMRKLTDDFYGEVIVEAQEGMKPISRFDGQGLYREYDINTSFETIKRDINQFYTTGRQPSITQQFRGSYRLTQKNIVTPLAKVYQEQKGDKKSYTKKDFEQDLAKLGYSEDMIKTAKDLFGIIRIKQIETTEPTPIEKELKKLQEREIKKSEIRNRIKRAYRLGANEKEKEIEKLQKIVTKYARENLPKGLYQKSEVTGLLAKLRDAKRFRELRTAMERIDRVIDKVSKRSALAKFNKVIKKKATVKKVGGIGRGKVGAEVQDIVNQIREVHKMSPVEVEERLEVITKIIDANQDGEPTDQQSVDINILMQYGGIKNKTPQQIAEATESLDALITQGRMQIMDEQQAYGERMSVVRQKILDVITGGEGGQTQAGAQKLGLKDEGFFKDLRKKLGDFDNDQQSLEYIFDKLSRFDKGSKPLESFINEYFMPMIRQARIAEYNGIVEMQKMLQENASRIFGVKGKKLVKLLNENTVNTINIDHYDSVSKEGIKGDFVTSTLTYNQAYKKWMELQDPTLSGTFEKMGWDVQKAIDQIEKQLPDKVLEWAKWQLYEFYPMYYARVNETFRKRFYVNMPMNAMYSPISRRVGARADEGDDTLNKSKSPMGSVSSAGSLKGRVSNKEELAWIDGDTTLMKHITEMEHFINYTDVMRELRSVFMSREISRSIRDFHGDKISRVLNKFMDDIARGGVDRAQQIDWMDWMRANFSRSVIGANPVVFLKQLSSIPAYIADIPASFWTKEFLKLTNPIEFRKMTKIISKSEVLKMRYDKGFDRDMMLALQNIKPGKAITGANFFNNAMYALTKLGDKQAIYLGGYPVYKYHLKQALKAGKSRKKAEQFAMKKFEQATLRSQQAGDVEDLADFQRRGSIAKLFTMFMTSPNQYYRMVAGGYRNLYYGRGSKLENFRKIFVGQILLPSLFTFIGNGFDWETDEQVMSLFLFPFSGLLFWGQGFEFAIRSAYRKAYPMGTVAILDPFAHAGKGLSKLADDKTMDSEKVLMIADQFIEGASKVAGVPYGAVKRTAKGVMKVAKGESEAPVRQIIGFNMPTKKKPKKKKKKKKQFKIAF
jgi:hypothetical protein